MPIPSFPSSSGSGTGTPVAYALAPPRRSLQNVRRLLAQKLHSLTLVATTSAGNATGTSLVAMRLATALDASRYRGAWAMPVDGAAAGQIRRCKDDNTLNTNNGELTVAPAFSAQIASGVNVELHRLLPPDDDDGWTGLRSCINAALREMWVPQRLSITGVNGQPSYGLSTYEEWLDPDAVIELRGAALDSTLNPAPAGMFEPVRNADAMSVQVSPTLQGGSTSTVEVFRPLDTYIKVAGVWGASTTGLVNDSDEALFNVDLLLTVALAHAYEALAAGPEGSRYDALASKQRLKANIAKQIHLDHRQRRAGSSITAPTYAGGDPKSFADWRPSNW